MLLIVGDGIHENLESMADMLYQPQMHFKLGLIEIQIFENPALSHRLLIPNLVAHSTELRRTVVKIEGGGQARVMVNIEEPPAGKARRVLSEDEFFAELRDPDAGPLFRQLLDFGAELGATPLWRSSSVGLRLPDPRGIRKLGFTLFLLNLDATVSDAYLRDQLEDSSGDTAIADERATALSTMFGVPVAPKYQALERGIPWRQVHGRLEDFRELMKRTVANIGRMQTKP